MRPILPYSVAFNKALLHKEFIDRQINQWPRDGLASKPGLSPLAVSYMIKGREPIPADLVIRPSIHSNPLYLDRTHSYLRVVPCYIVGHSFDQSR
jgi:hypothetical protein